jgi:integrase
MRTRNAAEGVEQLYSGGRVDQVWTSGEIDRFVAAAKTPEVGFIVRLACLTGLRRADLAKLAWSHVADAAIVMPTGKSRGRRNTVVPLINDTRTWLADIRTQQARRHAELCATAAKKRRPAPPIPTTVLSNNPRQTLDSPTVSNITHTAPMGPYSGGGASVGGGRATYRATV